MSDFSWPSHDGLTSEGAILADCQALVDAGLAEWVEERGDEEEAAWIVIDPRPDPKEVQA